MRFGMTIMAVFGSLAIVGASTGPAYAASTSTTPNGNDISFPQCRKPLPAAHAFGIVGVNDGRADTTNPCLTSEMTWARHSSGTTRQPKVSLYVNTGEPGKRKVADWPANNHDPISGKTVTDPYGKCAGKKDDRACAWQFGRNMAELDARIRGISKPGRYRWWLDVETITSWDASTWNNRADLEGMVSYFHRIGATVGIYSTTFQLHKILKIIPSTSVLYRLADWIPGARTLAQAQANCRSAPLTGRGVVTLTQWEKSKIDHDFSCKR
jgi:hypothetical protein